MTCCWVRTRLLLSFLFIHSPALRLLLPVRLLAPTHPSFAVSRLKPPLFFISSLLGFLWLSRCLLALCCYEAISGSPKDYSPWSVLLSSGSVRRFLTTEPSHSLLHAYRQKYILLLLHFHMNTETQKRSGFCCRRRSHRSQSQSASSHFLVNKKRLK
ncbi:hypothetical protein F5H01DRAFT_339452 [Linnemannia elongata]|nr:hypothetical protein F5H01DRAFT_339452 [Linnemannia elongata]